MSKAHIGADVASGFVHTLVGTAGNVAVPIHPASPSKFFSIYVTPVESFHFLRHVPMPGMTEIVKKPL